MPAPHPPPVRNRAREHVTTTTRTLKGIAAELRIGVSTLSGWIRRDRWTRPPGAVLGEGRKIPRAIHPALRRLYENRGRVADIAVVAGCSVAYLDSIADRECWMRRREGARLKARPRGELADIQAALRDPAVTAADALRHIERAAALAAADALAGEAQTERTLRALTRSAALIRERHQREASRDTHAGDIEPVGIEELRDELARRLERLRDAGPGP